MYFFSVDCSNINRLRMVNIVFVIEREEIVILLNFEKGFLCVMFVVCVVVFELKVSMFNLDYLCVMFWVCVVL